MEEKYKNLTDLGYTASGPKTFNVDQIRMDFSHADIGYPPLHLESTDDGLSWTIFRNGEDIFHGPIPEREDLLKLLDILTI